MDRLAEQLTTDVRLLSDYLQNTGHPQPSFNHDAPPKTLLDNSPEHVQLARERIMDNALQLFHLAAGPSEVLNNLSTGVSYRAIVSLFGIADRTVPIRRMPPLALSFQHLRPCSAAR